MQVAGLIEKRPDPADARLVGVHLTEHGRAARGKVARAQQNLERRAAAKLTTNERQQLEDALHKIIESLTR
jgi:DNA-binding MarR family transcriptional regulator